MQPESPRGASEAESELHSHSDHESLAMDEPAEEQHCSSNVKLKVSIIHDISIASGGSYNIIIASILVCLIAPISLMHR